MFKISISPKSSNTDLIITGIGIILILTAINAIFYSIGFAFSFKTGTYIIRGDYLADLYKIALSYPKARELMEAGNLSFPSILAPLLNSYYKYTYQGIEGLSFDQLTHFHLPPLTTAFTFLFLTAFSKLGFISTTLILLAFTFGLTIFSAKLAVNNKIDAYLFSLLIFISYPFIFFLQRGNFIAYFSFIFVLLAVIGLKRGKIFLPILLMAIAINFRPNLIVYAPLLFFWPNRSFARPLITFSVSFVIFLIALLFDSYIYPHYNLDNFLKGLKIYNSLFVIGDYGFGYSSSLFTLFKFIYKVFGLNFDAAYFIKVQVAFTISGLLYVCWLYAKKRIKEVDFLFVLTVISMLGTPIFADYHLLLYAIPAIIVILNRNARAGWSEHQEKINSIIFLTCCLMLSPLNYINYEGLYVVGLLKTLTASFVGMYLIFKNR